MRNQPSNDVRRRPSALVRGVVGALAYLAIMGIAAGAFWLHAQLTQVTPAYGVYARVMLVLLAVGMASCIGYFAWQWDRF